MQFAWGLDVIARDDLRRCPRWEVAFASERKDHRYYQLVEDTLHPEFDCRYFVIKDAVGQICAVQPFFLLDLDLLVGASPRFGVLIEAARWLRKKFEATARASPLEMSVMNDATPVIAQIYPLYLQVYERSKLHFEKLTEQYFCDLGRRMGEKVASSCGAGASGSSRLQRAWYTVTRSMPST